MVYIVAGSAQAYFTYTGFDPIEMELTFKTLRTNDCLLILLLIMKAMQFFELNTQTSPFIDIFYQIFDDIKYFTLVLVIFSFGFANNFWLLALN